MNYQQNASSFEFMLRNSLVFALLLSAYLVSAQVKVDATPTGKHAKAINTARQTREEAKQRKVEVKRVKKQLKEQKKARKLYRRKYENIRSRRLDSLNISVLTKEDSLGISEQILTQTDFPPEYRELILNPVELRLDSTRLVGADSVALARGGALAENVAREYLPDELNQAEDPLGNLNDPLGGGVSNNTDLPAFKPPSKPNPNLVKPDQAQALFKKIDPEQFQEAQADIQKLKKKYSELPDTRYPEEGTKRNSLEDKPFKNRLYFGGNLGIQSTDPFILDTNLQLGYWINKKWLGGVGIILREQFSNDTTSTLTGDGYGYSFFTRYDIPKGFFAWAEVERQLNRSLFNNEQAFNSEWQSAILAGAGREFRIGFVQMISMILYDFNYRNNDLNARPIVFKFGVRFSKKPE